MRCDRRPARLLSVHQYCIATEMHHDCSQSFFSSTQVDCGSVFGLSILVVARRKASERLEARMHGHRGSAKAAIAISALLT